MKLEYKYVSVKDIQRVLFLAEIESRENLLERIKSFSQDIANRLNSKILFEKEYEFPSVQEKIKNYTYVAILSSSHIVISTYISSKEKYIDVDITWCSRINLSREEFVNIFKKYFGKIKNEKFILIDGEFNIRQ